MKAASRPLRLGIDCSTPYLAIALLGPGDEVVASMAKDVGREHAARLVTELAALFTAAGREAREVAGIFVGVGPGSYTGTRIAVATAKGLARAWAAELQGVSTLLAVAAPQLGPGESGVARVDARRGNVYAQAIGRGQHGLTAWALSEPLKLSEGELPERFPGQRLLPGAVPDAAFLAAAGTLQQPPEPLYL